MSVDKFGRHSKKTRPLKGPKGEGYKLTNDGNFDVDNKLLRNVRDAVDAKDAVNKGVLDKSLSTCLNLNKRKWDARDLLIGGVGAPTGDKDAVSKGYLKTQITKQSAKYWSFNEKRLVSVSDPVDAYDVVTKDYMDQKAIGLKNGVWNANNKRIKNVSAPTQPDDAVNYDTLMKEMQMKSTEIHQVYQKIPKMNKDKTTWDFGNKQLKKITDPEEDQDAVNLRYLKTQLPERNTAGYRFQNSPLKDVGDPQGYMDAVNVNYLIRALSVILFDFHAPENMKVNADDKSLWIRTNVAEKYFMQPNRKFKSNIDNSGEEIMKPTE